MESLQTSPESSTSFRTRSSAQAPGIVSLGSVHGSEFFKRQEQLILDMTLRAAMRMPEMAADLAGLQPQAGKQDLRLARRLTEMAAMCKPRVDLRVEMRLLVVEVNPKGLP